MGDWSGFSAEGLLTIDGMVSNTVVEGSMTRDDMECDHTLLKMRILAFLPINPCSST